MWAEEKKTVEDSRDQSDFSFFTSFSLPVLFWLRLSSDDRVDFGMSRPLRRLCGSCCSAEAETQTAAWLMDELASGQEEPVPLLYNH